MAKEKKPKIISLDDKAKIQHHLVYEWSMLLRTAHLLTDFSRDELDGRTGKGQYSATVESFAVHVRNLFEFLVYSSEGVAEYLYVRAFELFDKADDWLEHRDEALMKRLWKWNTMASQQVEHITYHRTHKTPEEVQWLVWDAVQDIVQGLNNLAEVGEKHGCKIVCDLVCACAAAQGAIKVEREPAAEPPPPRFHVQPMVMQRTTAASTATVQEYRSETLASYTAKTE